MPTFTYDKVVTTLAVVFAGASTLLGYLLFADSTPDKQLNEHKITNSLLQQLVDGGFPEDTTADDVRVSYDLATDLLSRISSTASELGLSLPAARIIEGYTEMTPTNAVHFRLPDGRSTSVTMYQLRYNDFRVTIPGTSANFVRSGSRVELEDEIGCAVLFGEYRLEEETVEVGLDCTG